MHHLLRRRGAVAPTEAVRSPLAWAALTAAGRGGGFEARHPLRWIVPIALLELLLQVTDAGFQLRNVGLLLRDQRQRLLQPGIELQDQFDQLGVGQRSHHFPLQRHPRSLSGRPTVPVVLTSSRV